MMMRPLARPGRPPALLVGARPGGATPTRPPTTALAAGRRNDTNKGPRHEARPSAANARSRSRRRKGEGSPGPDADPLVPDELLREAQGTEAYRYARALAAAVSARRRPLALRTALALAVARPGRLLAPAAPAPGAGGGGVRPAALAARLVQLSETLGISVADAAELLAGAAGPEEEQGQEEEQEQKQQQQQQRSRRRAGDPAAAAPHEPPPAALEDVLPLRLLRSAEALVAALELDLDDDEEEQGEGEEEAAGRAAAGWLPPAATSSASSSSSAPRPYTLPPPPPPDDPRAATLRLAVRALARRPALLDATPLDVRRRAAAAAAALGLPPRLASRRLIAREPALFDVAPEALQKRLVSLARALKDLPSSSGSAAAAVEQQEALALALVLREPRLLLPPARALAANVAALPAVFADQDINGAPTSLPLLLLHAPTLALVPAAELARRIEALRRLLPTTTTAMTSGEQINRAPPPPWPLLRTPCGLEYDPRLLLLAPARLAERARHLQRLERLAAAAAAAEGGGGTTAPDLGRLRQRRARLLAVPSAALDGWCADALHLSPPALGNAPGGVGVGVGGSEAALAWAARRLLFD